MPQNPIMMLFPIEKAKYFSNKYLFIGQAISRLLFSLKYDLQKAEIDIDPERYCLAALISAGLYGLMFLFVGLAFGVIVTKSLGEITIAIMLLLSAAATISMLFFHIIYPKLAAGRIATAVDQELVFALRTLLIQLSSGVSLFGAMKAISKENYGQVAVEFDYVVKDVNSGLSETAALEKLAFRTKSEILKKSIWQILTTMKSGGSVVNALNSQVEALVAQQADAIKGYAAALNLWTLVYLIIAAAMPSLGVTFLVIASSISSAGIGTEAVLMIALLGAFVQVALIMLIRLQVPKVIK